MITIDRQRKRTNETQALFLNEEHQFEHQLEIDTELNKLSSRKLWQILKLHNLKVCKMDNNFIKEVKKELLARNDFDEGIPWREPH